jgi:hypothetical protein
VPASDDNRTGHALISPMPNPIWQPVTGGKVRCIHRYHVPYLYPYRLYYIIATSLRIVQHAVACFRLEYAHIYARHHSHIGTQQRA